MLQLSNVSKKIGSKSVLKNISFSLPTGKVLGLAGPNGAGKSTLLRLIAGILRPDTGDIHFQNQPQSALPKTAIAYVPQEIVLYEEMSAYENLLAFGIGLHPNARTLKKKISELTQSLSMEDYIHSKISSLSGGQKRRVHIAVALTGNPLLAILDEPTTGIDAGKIKEIEHLIHALRQRGCTILLSSHSAEFLDHTCSHLLLLNEGKSLFFGDFDLRSLQMEPGE